MMITAPEPSSSCQLPSPRAETWTGPFWAGLPEEHRKVIADTFDAQALEQRVANQKLDSSLEEVLTRQGLQFTRPDNAAFQAVLTKSGFYARSLISSTTRWAD